MQYKYPKPVVVWLYMGLFMVFMQVIIGGVTRLTESGLSITKWEVVEGTLPPLNAAQWNQAFELYKDTPQYKEVNEGITMSQFKFIYFWEYIHRFWARLMGFVFLVPFIFFVIKKWLDRAILFRLGLVILLSALAATFGWIMVASGLIERPWVNAYKLSIHLLIAFSVFVALLWTLLSTINFNELMGLKLKAKQLYFLLSLIIVQVFLGGVLSGMKAAVVYPTWPDMNGSLLPKILLKADNWQWASFIDYDKNEFMPALVHFLHRGTAYAIVAFVLYIAISYFREYKYERGNSLLFKEMILLLVTIILQALLGIITVITSIGKVSILWGVLHQGMALGVITVVVVIIYKLNSRSSKFGVY